ncbi:MAG: S9 family peptidase [Bacteroidia bacterium]|nr:S9 family peptidase [Bacteroidia bacterium]
MASVCFAPAKKNHLYYLDYFDGWFYIFSNYEAPNFRLLKTPVNCQDMSDWREVIPHRTTIFLEDFELFHDYLVWVEKENGLSRIRFKKWPEDQTHTIPVPENAYATYLYENDDFYTQKLRYAYESFLTPYTIYEYDMQSHHQQVLKQEKMNGPYQPETYHSERIFVPARDGRQVPVSLVYRKDLKKPEGNPLLLEGYGAYGFSNDVYFNAALFSLLDRGVVYAIAHVRGGSELGFSWYDEGRLLNKKNTFYDFIDVSEYLIRENYTRAGHIIAYGASAGGLLMGAVANERPERYKALVLDVPFVDVLNTMLNPNLPLTTAEYEEWGNPQLPEYYDYIASYAPYENVKAQPYPPMLFMTALYDARVPYWEPAKMVAKLRAMKTDKNPILLSVDTGSGHAGASGRYDRWQELARVYTYVLHQFTKEIAEIQAMK